MIFSIHSSTVHVGFTLSVFACQHEAQGPHPADILRQHGPTLPSLQGVAIGDRTGNELVGQIGSAFRRWCREVKKIDIPPCVWSMHMIGRGDTDGRGYPELDSNIKAAHTKPILFFLCEIANDLASKCSCSLDLTNYFDFFCGFYELN